MTPIKILTKALNAYVSQGLYVVDGVTDEEIDALLTQICGLCFLVGLDVHEIQAERQKQTEFVKGVITSGAGSQPSARFKPSGPDNIMLPQNAPKKAKKAKLPDVFADESLFKQMFGGGPEVLDNDEKVTANLSDTPRKHVLAELAEQPPLIAYRNDYLAELADFGIESYMQETSAIFEGRSVLIETRKYASIDELNASVFADASHFHIFPYSIHEVGYTQAEYADARLTWEEPITAGPKYAEPLKVCYILRAGYLAK